MKPGLTFDTGAVFALERRRANIVKVVETATHDEVPITVPVVVLAEWWRGRTKLRELILRGVRIDPLTERLAKIAGEALAAVTGETASGIPNALTIDAVVVASAASRGDIIYTSDPDDLRRFCEFFRSVKRIEKV
jgi:predicted nucleic acid-binding protein